MVEIELNLISFSLFVHRSINSAIFCCLTTIVDEEEKNTKIHLIIEILLTNDNFCNLADCLTHLTKNSQLFCYMTPELKEDDIYFVYAFVMNYMHAMSLGDKWVSSLLSSAVFDNHKKAFNVRSY